MYTSTIDRIQYCICSAPAGSCYAVFENSQQVAALVAHVEPQENGELYMEVVTEEKPHGKHTQIVPWLIADSSWRSPE